MNAAVGRGCSRWVVYFGAAGVLILVVFLFATARFMERSLVSLALRARQRVLNRLPPDLPPAERARTERNLERLEARLTQADRGPLLGEFLAQVTTALEDQRLTAAEVEQINRVLDGRSSGAGPAPSPSPSAWAPP